MSNILNTENHAQEIIQTQYDGQSGAGYLKFCDCKNGDTESLMDETVHQMLFDWDETRTHVIGLEILNFPLGKIMKNPLSGDLAQTKLSDGQKASVMERFLS
jgi:hypothetical protein